MYIRAEDFVKKKVDRLLLLFQACGKKTVNCRMRPGAKKTVFHKTLCRGWQKRGAVFNGKSGVTMQELLNDCLIFFRFERTGCIDENTTRNQQVGSQLQQVELLLLIAEQVFRLAIPADIGITAADTGAGAGCIDQDPVEVIAADPVIFKKITGEKPGKVLVEEPVHVFPEKALPLLFRFDSLNANFFSKLADVTGLAAKSGAGIEIKALFSYWSKEQDAELGSFILNLKKTLFIAGQGGDAAAVIRKKDGIRSVMTKTRGNIVTQHQALQT